MNLDNVNFYLKDPAGKGETLVYLVFRYRGNTLKYSTGRKVRPADWNAKKQRAKTTHPEHGGLNPYFDSLRDRLLAEFNRLSREGLPTPDALREALAKTDRAAEGKEKGAAFHAAFAEFIAFKEPQVVPGTVEKYLTLLGHLAAIEKKHKGSVAFDKFDAQFYERFLVYFYADRKVRNNTFGNNVKKLKTFLTWATERGYNTDTAFRKFKAPQEDADIVYLTWEELMAVYRLDLSEEPALDGVRDFFCLGCFTGQRYSDLAALKPRDINGGAWQVHTRKTHDRIPVPLSRHAKEILEKYAGREGFLPVETNDKTNRLIKEVCRRAGVDAAVTTVGYRGAERLEVTRPKWGFVTSHTARRTFVTLSLEMKVRPEVVMKVTGHKDFQTMKKYLKITEKVTRDEILGSWDRR